MLRAMGMAEIIRMARGTPRVQENAGAEVIRARECLFSESISAIKIK